MGEEITTIDISNVETFSASSFTNVKNSIDIKIDNSGNLTDTNNNAVTMLNFGDRGDHCVTVINAELPDNFSDGYLAYFLVNLKNKIYIQKCLMEGNMAKALITKEISLDSQSTECLFALIEANATTGNLREQQEIFVSDVFMGTVRSNFLDSSWMDADISVSEDLTVLDKFETPNPDKYTSMVWVNGETKLNAANMNNIIKGIDELKEQAVKANPTDDATNTLNKIKIGNKIYHIPVDRRIEKNGTFTRVADGILYNSIEFTQEEINKIKNKEIDLIYGDYTKEDGTSSPYSAIFTTDSDEICGFTNSVIVPEGETIHLYSFQVAITPEANMLIIFNKDQALVPPIPAENNRILVTNNGKLVYEDKPNKSNSTLKKDGTFKSQNGPIIINSINFTDEELERINNREIDSIYGSFDAHGSKTEYRVFFSDFFGDLSFKSYTVDIDSAALDDHRRVTYTIFTITIMEGSWVIVRTENDAAYVPSAPSTQNKTLVTDNGYLKYVDMPNHVIANPTDAATASLKTVKIGKTTYNITSSSSSGGSGGNCNSALFMKSDLINNVTNNTLIDGAFQELMDTFGAHKIPIIYDNNDGFFIFSGIAMGLDNNGDQTKIGFGFTNQLNATESSSQKYIAINNVMILWEDNSISYESSFCGIPVLPEDAGTKTYVLSHSTIGGTSIPTWVEKTDAAGSYLTGHQFFEKYADTSSLVGLNIPQIRTDIIDGKLLSMAVDDGNLVLYSDLYEQSKGAGFSMLHIDEGYMVQNCFYANSTQEELMNSLNKKYLFVPDLPTDASTTNYMLSSENGVLTWTKIEDKISSAINNAITSTLEANY